MWQRRKSKRSFKMEKQRLKQLQSSGVQICTNDLLPISRFLMCANCDTHQEVLLTEHLPSNVVKGLPSQPATCTCTHARRNSLQLNSPHWMDLLVGNKNIQRFVLWSHNKKVKSESERYCEMSLVLGQFSTQLLRDQGD